VGEVVPSSDCLSLVLSLLVNNSSRLHWKPLEMEWQRNSRSGLGVRIGNGVLTGHPLLRLVVELVTAFDWYATFLHLDDD
jgi:hypothetical protein